jgi:hypothetical protein
MPSLDSLPGDQRAVLQLVLSRGRSYDEIARMLSIDSSAVRERALAALRALGPQTTVSEERRGMISDYLLGQLADRDADQVRTLLAGSPSDRAWARVLSSELAPLASGPMPEIPVQPDAPEPDLPAQPQGQPGGEPETAPQQAEVPPRSSRIGGALLIAGGVVVVAAVVFLLVRGGGSSKQPTASTPASASTPAAGASATTPAASGSSTTSTTSGTSSTAKVVAQINLAPPASTKAASKAAGIAEILNEGSANGVAIVAQNVPANTTRPPNAYAVWLYNSPSDAQILGFVNPGVGKTGRLSTAGGLPTNAKHFKNLIVTLETNAKPKTPGTIVLEGPLSGL